jgi:ribosomal protein L28
MIGARSGASGPRAASFVTGMTMGSVMARTCAICGKGSMGGYNPQSSGMNRVRVHRRYEPSLQRLRFEENGHVRYDLVCTRCRRTLQKTA